MNKNKKIGIAIGTIAFIGMLIGSAVFISAHNNEVRLRTTIESKQEDNVSQFDNMKKKIVQVAGVTEKQAEVIRDIVVGYADKRGTSAGSGDLINAVVEAVPNVDATSQTFVNLQNVITGSRDSWTMRQRELRDLKREHDMLLRKFPANIVFSILGREEIEVTLITSSSAKESFVTGNDDDVGLFNK